MSKPNEEAISFNGTNGQTDPSDTKPKGEGQEQEEVTPEFVTREEFERSIEEAVSKVTSRTQGLVDKNANRLQKELRSRLRDVEQSIELAESSGVELTKEQKQAMHSKARDEVLMGADEGDEGQSGQISTDQDDQDPSAQEETGTSGQELNAESIVGRAIMADYGVEVYPSDKEADMIPREGTRSEYFAGVEKACEAKRNRLKIRGSGAPTSSGMSGRTHVEPIGTKNIDEIWESTGLASKK